MVALASAWPDSVGPAGCQASAPAKAPSSQLVVRARPRSRPRLGGQEFNRLEILATPVQFLGTGGQGIRLEQISENIGHLVARQAGRLVLGHGGADAVEQIAQTQAVKVR